MIVLYLSDCGTIYHKKTHFATEKKLHLSENGDIMNITAFFSETTNNEQRKVFLMNVLTKRLLPVFAAALSTFSLAAADLAIKNGDSIAFMGDSITQQGAGSAHGYLKLVIAGLKHAGLEVKSIPAGISGNKSVQMNSRVQRDVIDKKPTWMTLSCGVNDVWHGARGVKLDQYKKEITELCDKVDKAGIKIMILTATVFERHPFDSGNNAQLAPYNEWLRQFAKERGYLLADLNADMQKEINAERAKGTKGLIITSDGVHMQMRGNKSMARGILRAFGMTDSEIDTINEKVWRNIPSTNNFYLLLSEAEAEAFLKEAGKNGGPNNFIRKCVLEKVPVK